MNKLKQLFTSLLNDLKQADYTNPYIIGAVVMFLAVPVVLGLVGYKLGSPKNDIRNSSVKILNRAQNSGGTGIIYQSTASYSWILTNAHVCGVVKSGGIVHSTTGDYQVESYLESGVSDLCLIGVAANLGVSTGLSKQGPNFYDPAVVSGHPALMPNVISTGHVSGRSIIQVITGFKECSKEDIEDPDKGLVCLFLGGIPVIKSYESTLVTALIEPGSSGSGVYNSHEELIGVVFAGSGQIGYAWTVPYEQVATFLGKEVLSKPVTHVDQQMKLFPDASPNKFKNAVKKCETFKMIADVAVEKGDINQKQKESIEYVCGLIRRDALWVK